MTPEFMELCLPKTSQTDVLREILKPVLSRVSASGFKEDKGVFSAHCGGCGKEVIVVSDEQVVSVINPKCDKEPGYCLVTEWGIVLRGSGRRIEIIDFSS